MYRDFAIFAVKQKICADPCGSMANIFYLYGYYSYQICENSERSETVPYPMADSREERIVYLEIDLPRD